jgi:uncharacterized protein (DUF4415 family)
MAKAIRKYMPGRGYTKEDLDAVSDNPPWTRDELAQARPFAEVFPELAASIRRGRGPQKAPTKVALSIRLSRDVVEKFKAAGPGWQSRIDKALRKAAGL